MEMKTSRPVRADYYFNVKNFWRLLLCGAVILISGCAAGITRTGYQLPAGKTSQDLPKHPIAIQRNADYDTNDVVWLGKIHDYDTGFSTECDEAYILDIFCREGCLVGADLINITDESYPNILTSTCYRATAEFLQFKDRDKAKALLSDPQYASDLIIQRSVTNSKRNQDAIIGTVIGGPLMGLVVWSAVGSTNQPGTNSFPVNRR